MKALAVTPGKKQSARLVDIPEPSLDKPSHRWVRDGFGVKVRTLQVGVDATDWEINEALYGEAPEGEECLVLGHEVFGIVEEVGPNVTSVKPGDYVSCTVRRPGETLFDTIGRNDITSQPVYYERGICRIHGFMSPSFIDDAQYIVKVPQGLKHLGVLSEPVSVCAKAIEQAYLAQQRLQVWEPTRAFVMGAGQIGQLCTMMLRLRGLDVYTIARTQSPGLKEEICNGYGATYIGTGGNENALKELVADVGRPDLIVEATGSAQMAFAAMELLNLNGALVWTSVTGGEKSATVPVNSINLEWVLGNKLLVGSVNGNRKHFEAGIADLALAEMTFPGVTEKILTHPIDGYEDPKKIMSTLDDSSALKVYVNIAGE